MPKIILFAAFLFTAFKVAAQKPDKNFLSLGLGMDFPKDNIGFNFGGSVNGRISKGPLYLGLGLQFTKFKQITGLTKNLSLNISLIPEVKSSVFPLIAIQPGFSIYKDETFGSFFGGGGIGFSGKQQICFLFGYNSSRIKFNNVETNLVGFSAKTMIIF